ncbi:von Willebrand factor A [Sorangium cellulosum]|uniref:von Willebrand factor A n=1 Tax=Sorangium cellulosum TaxID=56 RepID=A0A2L0FAA0_SORCE|nr:VWA domain-containing protein [Sorangium cellulosum]AUX48463.1 von Willebrand factor A [Sorangium cellulosum]
MTRRSALSLAILVLALCVSCKSRSDGPSPSADTAPATKPSPEPARAPVTVVVAYGSEKKTWLEEQAKRFEQRGEKTKGGRPIVIEAKAMGSGEVVQGIAAGQLKPHVFSPASAVYVSLLNSAWSAKTGATKPISPAGDPLVLSPIVVAMWKPMAEALGWPEKPIGWRDLVKVSADPKGWGAHGHPEWGRFKLGHTHPEYSNSGLLAVLAEAYAGAGKTRGLTAADLEVKATQDHLRAIEQTLVHYGQSTGFFADKMLARGPAYLSAAVLYENLVIESYTKTTEAPFPVVAVYPVEGTFWSDHPYAVLDAAWVGAEEREGAQAFLRFLKEKPQQERALALGFRPADPSIPIGAPVDAAHGVDPKQPQTLLEVPDGATLEKLLAVWQDAKKTSDVILVFDKSGSMAGRPLAEAKKGARSFLDILHDRDDVTLLFFDGALYPPIGPKQLGKDKADLVARIDGTVADGKTALYDAVAKAHELALARARAEPARIHAIVVMTDGRDEHSQLPLDGLMKRFSTEEAPVKIFTIAYGEGADPTVLEQIAEAAKGSSARGATDTIVAVYKEMASFF